MTNRPLLYTMLGLSAFALASCEDDTTQPNPAAASSPSLPEFLVAHNTWTTRRDMPYERWDLAVTVLPNAAGQSIVYAIGGRTATSSSLGRVQAYNVATNTWSWKKDMPFPVYHTNGAGVINGKIYISGGLFDKDWAYEGVGSALQMYDPATNTWTREHDMPSQGAWGVTGVLNGKLYVVTACIYVVPNSNMFDACDPSRFFRYNPATDRWVTLPSPKNSYSTGAVVGDQLYVTDGKHTEAYDPATNRWTVKASGGQQRIDAAATAQGAKLYLMGGRQLTANRSWQPVRTTRVYHPSTDTWTTVAPMPTARYGMAAIRVFLDGRPRIEVVGGSLPGNNLAYVP